MSPLHLRCPAQLLARMQGFDLLIWDTEARTPSRCCEDSKFNVSVAEVRALPGARGALDKG